MDSEYPPLPRSKALETSLRTLSLQNTAAANTTLLSSGSEESLPVHGVGGRQRERGPLNSSLLATKVISSNGDVIIEYTDWDGSSSKSHPVSHRWQVASGDFMQNSPYFRALLDPNKFAEGRQFMEQKIKLSCKSTLKNTSIEEPIYSEQDEEDEGGDIPQETLLPTVGLPVDRFTRKLGVEVIELFLKLLSLNSFSNEERQEFAIEIRSQSPSLIARLVEIADVFNSVRVVRETLKSCGYSFGKGKVSLIRFNPSLLKISEDRIRQMVFVAMFLEEQTVFQVLTHTLIVLGSRFWLNGVGFPNPDSPRWRYLENGIEEELYYRRQCVLNTITDLQAYFLRAYGALEEDPDDSKPAPTASTLTTPSIRQQPRQFQCRWAFGNSSACDAFHLGQITRLFALRTKTIFLGSTLIDPDFTLDSDSDSDDSDEQHNNEKEKEKNNVNVPGPTSDISSLIASLKQCPDYQIDSNHNGCGVRRRLLPALDCIERFVGDGRGLLGIVLRLWDNHHYRYDSTSTSNSNSNSNSNLNLNLNMNSNPDGNPNPTSPHPPTNSSWANSSLRRAYSVDIRFSKIIAMHSLPRSSSRYQTVAATGAGAKATALLRSGSPEEDARLLFTARKRNWEA